MFVEVTIDKKQAPSERHNAGNMMSPLTGLQLKTRTPYYKHSSPTETEEVTFADILSDKISGTRDETKQFLFYSVSSVVKKNLRDAHF